MCYCFIINVVDVVLQELELAELILKRDAEVITDAYYKRVKAYKARRDNEEDD